jgi:hypothetical protein
VVRLCFALFCSLTLLIFRITHLIMPRLASMASFSRKLQSLSLSGRNKDDDNDKTERKSRSLFSGFGSSSSSNHSQQPSSSSNRSPSPYAGRSLFREGSKSRKKHRHLHDRNRSSSDVEYAGATSSANVSEAESDGEGRLSRLTSNSSLASVATGNSALAGSASTSAATTPSNASATSTPSTGNSVSFAEQQFPPKSSAAPRPITQAGRGAPRNAFYDSGSDSDGEHDQRRRPVQQASSTTSLASAPASISGEQGLIVRGSEPTSDSEDDEPSHEEYARSEGDEDSDDLLSGEEDMDPTVLANTEANAGSLTAAELLSAKPALLAGYGDDDPDAIYYDENGVQEDWPNLVKPTASPFATTSTTPTAALRNTALATTASAGGTSTAVGTGVPIGMTRNGRGRGGTIKSEIPLVASRPVYQRNRCTITLTHGDPDAYVQVPGNMSLLDKASKTGSASTGSAAKDSAAVTADAPASGAKYGTRKKRKGKTYVVASDLSEESYYAIEWAIGTVLRSGDELLFVTVMETDSKRERNGLGHDWLCADIDLFTSS